MPPRRNMPHNRRILTRSLSDCSSRGLVGARSTCFRSVVDGEGECCSPRFDVRHAFAFPHAGHVEKRAGLLRGKVAFRGKVPTVRLDSMKNLFDALAVNETEMHFAPEVDCNYCKSMKKFLYGNEGEIQPDGICTCQATQVIAHRTLWTKEPTVRPTRVEEVHRSVPIGPKPCRVVNPFTGMEWNPTGRMIRVVSGAQRGLHYWSITGTIRGGRVYVFGYKSQRKGWIYATMRRGRVFFFEGDDPSGIDIDGGGGVNDPRAFCLAASASSGGGYLLVSAMDRNLVATFNKKNGHLSLTRDKNQAFTWRIESLLA